MASEFPPVDEQVALIKRGAIDLVDEDSLRQRLQASRASGRQLRVKFGIDPSSPDIHLGHTVILRKLHDFQRLGHLPVVLWGTATAMVGDPTGKNRTRPQLTREEVEHNKQTYRQQIGDVLDVEAIEERENGEWFDRMSFMDGVRLAAGSTVAQMLERDSFAARYRAQQPISIHELLYPLMQGHDSVELEADVELGGSEQLFNLMVGREFQRRAGQVPQICLTMPLLVGLDGTQKMSKSLGNYIGIADPATQMFGKCMSVPDALMRDYFTLLTDVEPEALESLLAGHPRAAKVELAQRVTAGYHGEAAAAAAVAEFDRMFREGGRPDAIAEVAIDAAALRDGSLLVAAALASAEMCKSNSDGRRLIQGGGVKVDGVVVTDPRASLTAGSYLLQSGKRRHAKVVIPG